MVSNLRIILKQTAGRNSLDLVSKDLKREARLTSEFPIMRDTISSLDDCASCSCACSPTTHTDVSQW